MYAVIEILGKQFRVTEGTELLVDGGDADVTLTPRVLLWVDGDNVVTDTAKLGTAKVTLSTHGVVRERLGRTMHFKPKKSRSSKRIMGHRRERVKVTIDGLKLA